MPQIDPEWAGGPPATGHLEPGKYPCVIVASEVKSTRDGKGKYVALRYAVTDGPHARRQFFSRHNVVNRSQEAVRIGKAQLAAIRIACGIDRLVATEDLHNKPLVVTLARNRAGDVVPVEWQGPQQPPQQQTQVPQQAQAFQQTPQPPPQQSPPSDWNDGVPF